jgi:two-component system response regulator
MAYDVIDILLVEDNPQDAELMIRSLKKTHVANPIFHVEDGAEALDFLYCRGSYADRNSSNVPKVVFLDLKLPKVSGLEVLRQIKADIKLRSLPIVVVTSSREDPDVKAAYELGVNSYVVKPVAFDSFVETMKNLGYYWLLVNETGR